MGWEKDQLTYTYAPGTLRAIASCYDAIYEVGLYQTSNDFRIAEYLADFDIALSAIGKEDWLGLGSLNFKHYRDYGRVQQVVIADILGITDYELEAWGFYQIPQLRGRAYKWMANRLNGLPYGVQFIARGG